MPNLSWNEIRNRAVSFAGAWSGASREQADKQTFWNEFFDIFGIPRRTVASFEEPVRRLKGTYGFIDLLWRGKLLIEHKSSGASLEAAETQAFDYLQDLQTVGRGDEIPRYVLLSDFGRFALYDLEPEDRPAQRDLPLFRNRFRYERIEFTLADLPEHIRAFAFIPGYQVATYRAQDPFNLKAVEIMAGVHDTLKAGGFTGHELERLLVRVLFCLFAGKTGIFLPDAFRLFVENRTSDDGSNLGAQLNDLFLTLNKPESGRQTHLNEDLKSFPYVNGALFAERLESAAFTAPMRKALLNACNFKWDQISPAIFGALFQEVMKPIERRKIGAHYTSERDILKVIHPLFLDKLRAEFVAIDKDRSGRRANRLEDFRVRLTQLKFLDPACGCGNFLVIAYRELRALELDVLRAQHAGQQAFSLDEVNRLSQVDVHQFYGIEIEEWPARIAEVALWLTDHQANLRILGAFSQPFLRLPLRNSPHIHLGNALRMDWNDLLPASECSYVMGNPPFVGKAYMSDRQKEDVSSALRDLSDVSGSGVLDYVAGWYFRAAAYANLLSIPICFVSTNSITQGEQPAILWSVLHGQFDLEVQFAYRTFTWVSEARGAAHVHVVIMGLARSNPSAKTLFDGPLRSVADTINPYLLPGKATALKKRSTSICGAPEVIWGSMPNDGGHLLLTATQKNEFLQRNPGAESMLRRIEGANEFLYGIERWCFWLVGVEPAVIAQYPEIMKRIEKVKDKRSSSGRPETRRLAATPSIFGEIRQPSNDYLLIPETSSEVRRYIPIAMRSSQIICSNLAKMVPDAHGLGQCRSRASRIAI